MDRKNNLQRDTSPMDGHFQKKEENMEDTRKEEIEPLDGWRAYTSSTVSVKQEPLDEDVYTDVKYKVVQNQTKEVLIHSLPAEICMKQELLTTCEREAFIVCTIVKTDDVTVSAHLDDVMQTESGGPFYETKPVAQHICITSVPFTSKTETIVTDFPGPDFHRSLPVSTNLTVDETHFPLALYQHQRIQPIGEMTSYEYDEEKYHRTVASGSEAIIATSPHESTSDKVTSEHRFESEKKTHRCSVCDFSTVRKRNFASHMMTHTGEKPYKCSVCSFSTAYKNNLMYHKRTHTGEKPYECSVCGFTTAYKTTLVYHTRTHTGEKPYKCSICSYSSARKTAFVLHMRIHEKPYKCSMCDYSSAQKYNIVFHMRTHTCDKPPTGDKLFKCPICKFYFSDKSHMRTHTREKLHKPYKCSMCNYRSANNADMIMHTKLHTG